MEITPQILLEIPLIISTKKNNVRLELRKTTTEINIIKFLISCAVHNQPIIITPTFTNKLLSINNLIEKGIIYFDQETQQYNFTI